MHSVQFTILNCTQCKLTINLLALSQSDCRNFYSHDNNINFVLNLCCVSLFFLGSFVMFFQYIAKDVGADPVMFGYLQAAMAIMLLLGSPIFGRFGDVFGSRAALVLAFAATTLNNLLLGMARTVNMLFVSRIPALFMHNRQGTVCLIIFSEIHC